MAKVICDMKCKHRSKRPLKTYIRKNGLLCYGCMLDAVSILRIVDPDDYIIECIGEENMAICANYEPLEE